MMLSVYRSIAFLGLVSLAPLYSFAESLPTVAPLLQPFVDRGELAGAVMLVADKEKILSVEAVGYADIARRKPMAPDTLFWIASQSKGITAVAVLMLVGEGKIELDAPVEKYLPEFEGQMLVVEKDVDHQLLRKPSHPITIREILSHTSGLLFASAIEKPTLDGLPLEARVRSYAAAPLQSEPGTRYQYSNEGINTAGRVVEVVSGMSIDQFMEKRIFGPLGMNDTTFWPSEEQVSRLAKSYKPNAAKDGLEEIRIGQLIYPLTDRAKRFPMPAGGLFSTARDIGIFCRMLLNGGELDGKRYLSPAMLGELTKRQTASSLKESYGLGLEVGGGGYGHGGAFATNMNIQPAKDLLTVWMVQHAGYLGEGGKADEIFKNWAAAKFATAR